MKNLILATATLLTLSFTIASCSKCATCTKSGGSEVKLCEKDYGSNTEYGLAKDAYEAQGYDCQ